MQQTVNITLSINKLKPENTLNYDEEILQTRKYNKITQDKLSYLLNAMLKHRLRK